MGRDEIISQLRAVESRLRELGVASLAVFGSVARDEADPDSDVDLLVQFDAPATFDRYMDLKLFLEELLDRRVELVTDKALRQEVRPQVERELLRVA